MDEYEIKQRYIRRFSIDEGEGIPVCYGKHPIGRDFVVRRIASGDTDRLTVELASNGADIVLTPIGSSGGGSASPAHETMKTVFEKYTDFMDSAGLKRSPPTNVVAAGAGANALGATTIDLTNHPGVWRLTTGVTAAGRVYVLSDPQGSLHIGAGITRVGTWLRTSGVLSNASQRYAIRSGLLNVELPNTVTRGIGFEYSDDVNGGRWQAIAVDDSAVSTGDTGVSVTPGTWYLLEVEANAAGDSVEYFVDGVSVGTLTTNLPTGSSNRLFYNTHIMKLAGTQASEMFIDAMYIRQEVVR